MKKIVSLCCLAVVLIILPAIAWASPHTAICLASSFVGNSISNDGRIRASKSFNDSYTTRFTEIVIEGRSRIEKELWSANSAPHILFLDGKKVFGFFDYNKHGSSAALPNKTCLMIGPKGTNVDVVAHELVHADIAKMLGYWRNLSFPAWVNEGVAMQVDFRKRYNAHVLEKMDPQYVTSINGSEFYKNDVESVVRNYAAAKHIIAQWIEAHGKGRMLLKLNSDSPGLLYQ